MISTNSHSDPPRQMRSGFTLLETVVALAILSLVLAAGYSLAARGLTQSSNSKAQYEMTQMARAVLEEYLVTYPLLERTGTHTDKWTWSIQETQIPALTNSDLNTYFNFVEVSVVVRELVGSRAPVTLDTVVARLRNE